MCVCVDYFIILWIWDIKDVFEWKVYEDNWGDDLYFFLNYGH